MPPFFKRPLSRHAGVAGLAAGALLSATAFAQQVVPVAQADAWARASMPEYLKLLSMPTDAANPADIQQAADWLVQAFTRRGFQAQTLANVDKPLVLAEWAAAGSDQPTVLFYMHFDAQPVVPSEWQTDPWTPTLRVKQEGGKDGGVWQTLPIERLTQGVLNPEWRVFARASADDKAPITMFLAAIDGMKQSGLVPSVNIKVLLDAEEEKGSPRLHEVLQRHLAQLKSDGVIVYDGVMPPTNLPVANFGNRGSIQLDLTVFGATSPQHSGHYGNVVPNPALNLTRLLDSMKDASGRVRVAGFYDGITVSDADRQLMARMAPPTGALEKRMGVAKLEMLAANPLESVQYPSLDILGIQSGLVGLKAAANAIPASALASLNVRTVPETPPEHVLDVVRRHVQAQGYHLINGEAPTPDERVQHPRLARLTMTAYPSSSTAGRVAMDSPLANWVLMGLRAPRGIEPEKVRMGGSTLPMGGVVTVLKQSYVLVPLVNADNNQHGVDENMRMGNYVEGIRTIAAMLTTPLAPLARSAR